ncbi:MAG TPA: chemotaxis-specific protein-glutamate methyltransferase CheB [Candidatus Krumholzibacteriaceae bacterium]|nr:chemotaxis-specific protein-glutamate methyltransferase CheB [Candidatus Krumholzibacteriaceae bacterium]
MENRGQKKIRVLIGEDSQFVSTLIADVFKKDPSIELVGVAGDGHEILKKVADLKPDCITLDLEMPRMNGLETLRYIMSEWPTPVVILSACSEKAAMKTLTCLEYGAVDFIPKTRNGKSFSEEELLFKVKMAAGAQAKKVRFLPPHYDFNIKRPRTKSEILEYVIVVGASSGGPRALMDIIPRLPADLPAGVVVVQHMPSGFTRHLAERLDERSKMVVREARSGDVVLPGRVLLAPGGNHLIFEEKDGMLSVVLLPRNEGQRTACPSMDFAMSSLAPIFKEKLIGVVLTGMGRDGLSGSEVLRKFGGRIIAQDPATCIVSGMAGSVIREGLANLVVPLDRISEAMVNEIKGFKAEVKLYGNQ